jgi:hypothetical protein
MTNYTEQLKINWKSTDMVFVATFKRINNNAGVFIDFTNPVTNRKIYYPEIDSLEILDKRISLYCGNSSDLTDGAFYKVELDHTDNPKGKNNTYSLKIKSISVFSKKKVEKEFSKGNQQVSSEMKFFGVYGKKSEKFASFTNVILADSGDILMFQGESQNVFVSPNIELSEGRYYSFSILKNEGKLPNAIPNSIVILEKNPYKEHIRLRFERLNSPEANKIIANLMREIGKGMYSSKQRMIFELLQNADDAPGKEKVEFHIDANGDYLFIMHDGASFSKDDVEAITSAAESTKRKDKKKTGYKGIGFKSTFTDSTEVWLKSGGYQFAFIRESPLFEDFESFYFTTSDYQKYPGLVADHRRKYQKDISAYDNSTDIPWQVIPIWQDNLPSEFADSNFNNFNNPVQFALKVGTSNIYTEHGYLAAIDNVVKRPQFLLFLRNTSKFRSPKNKVTVTRTDNGHLIKIEKTIVEYIGNKSVQKQDILEYTKQVYSDIQVNNDAFSNLNIGLRKIVEKNDLNEDTYHFIDLDGNKIETIPPKLASATETEISFGILLVDNKISPEKEYTKGLPKYSSLFTYLPMEDTRFQLPFLVNADFVPSSDRQLIQGDNLWNKYIMIRVAEKHVDTLAFYAQEFLKDNSRNGSYLSLLLKNKLPEDDTAQQIIDSYNHQYLVQLVAHEIVVNDINQTQLLSNTIIDDSGLIELFGHDIFYEIINTEKRLPHSNIDTSYLKDYDYLAVEVIDLEKLAEQITPEICEGLGAIIADKSLYDKLELLKWLNKLVKYIPDDFGKIPFIIHNNTLFSLDGLIKESDAWLINKNTSKYETLIMELGYHAINLNIDKYSNIKEYLHSFSGYINDKNLVYERIKLNGNLPKLSIVTKLKLIDFLQNSDFMRGVGETKYFGELELFVDESGKARPLKQLLSREETIEVKSLHKFRIVDIEFDNLTDTLKKELIAKDESFVLNEDLFQEWSHHYSSSNINIYINDLKAIYALVGNIDKISIADWASIPWMYIDDETRFVTTDKAYWSSAFNKLSTDNYKTIKSILHISDIKTLPLQACGEIIQVFKLKTDNNSDIDWLKVNDLELFEANTLLDWMESDGGFSDFFDGFTLNANENKKYTIQEVEEIQIYNGADKELNSYLQTNEYLSIRFTELDKNLCSEDRNKIGLLQGDKLLKTIIESGSCDQSLAVHLPSKISYELFQKFIDNLTEFNLKTGVQYNSKSAEHIIINQLLKIVEDISSIPVEVQNTLEELRNKITINTNPLSNYNISDLVSFGTKDDRKVLKLSDILTEFQGDSDVLDAVKESFIAITQKEKLRKLIFKTIPLRPEEIHSKIEEETNTYYSVHQVAFQLLDKAHGGKRKWSKQRFDTFHLSQGDENQLETAYQLFLDILIELPFTELSDFKFHDFKLKSCVDKNFALESELIPIWLEDWLNRDQSKRLEFLVKQGYSGAESAIVNFRKSLVVTDYDQNSVIRYFEESKLINMQVIWNTIVWLSDYNPNIITRNIAVIKQVNDYIKFKPESIEKITIPVINVIDTEGKRSYHLQTVSTESILLKINSQNEFANSVFKALNSATSKLIFVDESIGKLSEHLSVSVILLEEAIDLKRLEKESKLWDAAFYRKWEHYQEYPIYVYNGDEIPYLRTYKDIIINEFTSDLKVSSDGKYYVSKFLKTDILNNIPSSFPSNILSNLQDWHYKTLQNESLLDEDSFDYKEDIDRLLQDRLGISEEDQKRESGNAKTHAVYYLDEHGYDISNVDETGAALTNIIDPEGNCVNCIVRSAKGGLLYLDKEHWDMIEDDDMFLIVIYPGNSPRLFKNRLELLEEELAENILFRIPNNKNITEIDGVFKALESEPHIILVTSEKMKENLFSKLKQKRNVNKKENAAVGGDDFKL